ncbi:MAG: HIT family protein [Methylocystis silviterrae]
MTPNDPCPFCNPSSPVLIVENELAFAIRDKFPIRPLHTLVIPKRHAVDIFQTTAEVREALHEIASKCRSAILREHPEVGGFNFGSNVGQAAGQKIFHAHLHLIPRRTGDTPPPPARPND